MTRSTDERVERPGPYIIRPGKCAAPASPTRLAERCGEPALLYPCGRRCHAHRPQPDAVRPAGGAA